MSQNLLQIDTKIEGGNKSGNNKRLLWKRRLL